MENNAKQGPLILAMVCALGLGSAALAVNSYAATATGTASATVIEPISVSSMPVTAPFSISIGGVFDPATFAGSLSTSGPLLRFGSPPPASTVTLVIGPGGGAPSQANSTTVTVTKNANGTVSISVTGGVGLMFSIMRTSDGAVTIEYN